MSDSPKYLRRCIHIKAEDSPNVKYGLMEQRLGIAPSNKVLVPGVLTYGEYTERRKTWDEQRQCEGLDAKWYEGPALKLVPGIWLDAAESFAEKIKDLVRNLPRYMGVDSGEGGDDSCWCIGDRLGVMDIEALKTPDTNVVYGHTLEMMRKWNIPPERVVFDLGGGGTEHVNRLRANGYQVRATGFGKKPKPDLKRGMTLYEEKRSSDEDAYAYINRRSEMYWDIRMLLERNNDLEYIAKNWNGQAAGFALPPGICKELRRQLEPVPLRYDGEGRFKLIPKQNPLNPKDTETFRYLIGRSPDHADAFALMIFGMTHKPLRTQAGAG